MNKLMHLDANESAFFTRELEFVKARTYDTKFKTLKATSLIPVSNEAPSGADQITFRRYTGVGFAKIIADYAKDFPRVDAYGEEETVKVRGLGDSYGYSVKEIRRAAMAGAQLETRRATAARRGIDELTDRLAWGGDAEYGIQGLINYPGITEYTVPADGTGSSKLWSAKTPKQIVRDMNGLVTAIVNLTSGREMPDTIIMPIEQYRLISSTPMSDLANDTILSFFQKTNPGITVEWVQELDQAGASGVDRMMAYARDPEHLTLEIPQPFEQLDVDKEGMEYKVPCHAETAGVIVYYPLSVAYADGI